MSGLIIMEEIWKTIIERPNYTVSNLGRVKTLPHLVRGRNGKTVSYSKPNRILKPTLKYNVYGLELGSIAVDRQRFAIKYLVYTAFIGCIPKGYFVINIDGNDFNCDPENLKIIDIFELHNLNKNGWVPIKDFENYIINQSGDILNTLNGNRCAWTYSLANKCWSVRLWKNNTSKLFYLYRLVAIHFMPNPDNKPQVNHIDGDRMNLSLSNLEWVTPSENMKHAARTGLAKGLFEKGVANRFRHLNNKI